jgi:2-isopropylmalate synthase
VDLLPVIANLRLKMKCECLQNGQLNQLTAMSRYIYEMANQQLRDNQPYVGRSAFAHKGGIHVSAVSRNPLCYEHVAPESVGNERRVLISELSGRSNVLAMLGERYKLNERPDALRAVLDRVQNLENEGYQFEAAEASFELLVRKALGEYQPFFELLGFRVITEIREDGTEVTEATIKLRVDNQVEHTASEGNGPVNALDGALRKALLKFYPALLDMHLVNYRVRIVNAQAATAARVLVQIESAETHEPGPADDVHHWTTVGVSENIIEASWHALVDSIEYKLFKERVKSRVKAAAEVEG